MEIQFVYTTIVASLVIYLIVFEVRKSNKVSSNPINCNNPDLINLVRNNQDIENILKNAIEIVNNIIKNRIYVCISNTAIIELGEKEIVIASPEVKIKYCDILNDINVSGLIENKDEYIKYDSSTGVFGKEFNCPNNYIFGIFYAQSLYAVIFVGSKSELSQHEINDIKNVAAHLSFVFAINKSLDISRNVSTAIISEHKTQKLKLELIKEKNLLQEQQNFITTASHEMRTPIAIIQSSIELLNRITAKESFDLSQLKPQFAKLNLMSERLQIITESILSLEKFENCNFKFYPKNFVFIDTINNIIDYHKSTNENVNIISKFENLPEKYNGDKKLITLILDNLISNAIKYSTKPEIVISGNTLGNYYTISVIDNGIGIPEEEIPSIFNKYFRATNTSGTSGSGIGLYLCKRLADLQEILIDVKSKVDVGTTITLKLPFEASYQIKNQNMSDLGGV